MTRRALVVTCNEYQNVHSLQFCHRDGELLRDTLVGSCDFDAANVELLQPTLKDIVHPEEVIKKLKELADRSQEGDTLLFFFAGHGSAVTDDAFLLLPDYERAAINDTAIRLSDISGVMRESKRTCIRVFDACHSGVDVRDGESEEVDGTAFSRAIAKEDQAEGWLTIASCRPEERSYEDPAEQHGVFTKCFCDAIKAVPEGQDILPESIYDETYRRVQKWNEGTSRVQRPMAHSSFTGVPSLMSRVKSLVREAESRPETPDLVSKLTLARSSSADLVQHRVSELEPLPGIALKVLAGKEGFLADLGLSAKSKKGTTQILPSGWQPPLVEHFETLSVRSLHSIRSYEVHNHRTGFMAVLSYGSTSETKYSLNSGTYPEAVAILEWSGDEFTPSGNIVSYFIPLETRMYFVVGVYVHSFSSGDRGHRLTTSQFAELNDDWEKIVTPAIEKACASARKRVEDSINARLAYLERERKLGGM